MALALRLISSSLRLDRCSMRIWGDRAHLPERMVGKLRSFASSSISAFLCSLHDALDKEFSLDLIARRLEAVKSERESSYI